MFTSMLATGKTTEHLALLPGTEIFLHKDVIDPFLLLQADAQLAGFGLAIASGFRSFERQCIIWNEKVLGKRAVFTDDGSIINPGDVTEWQLICAILRWSALPGASRHHWGTDFDIYDKQAILGTYKLQLTPAETCEGGVFEAFYKWLEPRIASNNAFGFYRPYETDCGGVGCEPWHLSYKPLADITLRNFKVAQLYDVVSQSNILLRDTVLQHLDEIFERFVLRVN